MLGLRWWAWEFIVIFAGWRSKAEVDATVVLFNIFELFQCPPYGIALVYQNFISYLFGQGRLDEAKRYSRIARLNFLGYMAYSITLLLLLHENLLTLFTQDPETVEALKPLLHIFPVLICLEGYTTIQGAFVRSLNLQKTATILTLVSYYAVGIPFGLLLGFGSHDMGVLGVLIGFAIGIFLLNLILDIIIECSDWHYCAQEMQAQIEREK